MALFIISQIIPTLTATAQIGAAVPLVKPPDCWMRQDAVIEALDHAHSSSDFDRYALERPTFRPLWKIGR